MQRVVFKHPVEDVDQWASKHSERVEYFKSFGSNVVDCISMDGSKNVSVTVDVHDMNAMNAALESPEIAEAKKAHGVLEPLAIFIQTK